MLIPKCLKVQIKGCKNVNQTIHDINLSISIPEDGSLHALHSASCCPNHEQVPQMLIALFQELHCAREDRRDHTSSVARTDYWTKSKHVQVKRQTQFSLPKSNNIPSEVPQSGVWVGKSVRKPCLYLVEVENLFTKDPWLK